MKPPTRGVLRTIAVWAPCVTAAVVLAVSILTEAPAQRPTSFCLFRNLTGLPCPGCGMTRGFVAVGHGRFAEAWRAHPFAPAAFAAMALYVIAFPVLRLRTGRTGFRLSRRPAAILVAVVLAFVLGLWALRLWEVRLDRIRFSEVRSEAPAAPAENGNMD